ncbi:hypothetical protein BASA50_000468 [Batrachochytrium salamandrivorans]|uniref:SCP domain-containing protein n=1 Tax=Batrachochytrium salamandrivorans TaxID=1357716 RepID=A0ABQ8ETX9_9FUNG|nr:hypothetical protein BASA50_000468 [Batrachochytrium salamandrivorans]KAH9275419.1 hypothetical protein BASA83_002192 [Batrachochytrium salamandrivorans]
MKTCEVLTVLITASLAIVSATSVRDTVVSETRHVYGAAPVKLRGSSIAPPPRKSGNTGPAPVKRGCLDAHNYYRNLVGVPIMAWSRTEQGSAQNWANHLAQTNTFAHSRAGENLGRASGNINLTCEHGLQTFFAEYSSYDGRPIAVNALFICYGHYTQLVWPSTTAVGCGVARNNDGQYLVCHYNPAGNVIDQRAPVYRK